MAAGFDVGGDAFEDALARIEDPALGHRLVGAGIVDLKRRPAVEPVVGAAQARAFRGDDADVVRGEGLAQQAGIKRVHGFVGHGRQPAVAFVVDRAGVGQAALDLGRVGDQRHAHLVHDGRVAREQLGVQDLAVVPQAKAALVGGLGHARPDDVALAHVPDAFRAVEQVVDLALQNGFEIGLHLAPGDLDPDGQRQRRTFWRAVDVVPDDLDHAVVDRGHVHRGHELEAGRPVAAEFDAGVVFADQLALESRAVGHRDGHLVDFYFAAANFQGAFDHGGVGHTRDNMLVGAHAAGQDLGDSRVGHHRKAEIDRPGGQRIFLLVHLAQGQDKGENAVFVVEQVGPAVSGFDPAEGHGHPAGKPEGVHQGRGLGAKRHEPGFPAELHAF